MERITAKGLRRSRYGPAQGRAVRFGHVHVDDAVFATVEERRMTAFGEIQELVGQDEIARLVIAVQRADSVVDKMAVTPGASRPGYWPGN